MTFVRTALQLFAAPVTWAAHFVTIYAFTGVACARGFGSAVPWAVAIATLAAAAACVLLFAAGWRRRMEFEGWLSSMLASLALVAIAWEAIAALLVAPCA